MAEVEMVIRTPSGCFVAETDKNCHPVATVKLVSCCFNLVLLGFVRKNLPLASKP
jgi:hypothetical protein